MARKKGSSSQIHIYLQTDAYQLLCTECARLKTRKGKLLSKILIERAPSFGSRPLQLIDRK
jgi:hypothetical protein